MFPKEKVSVMRPRRTTEHSAHWALGQVLILRAGKCGERKMTVSKTAANVVLLNGIRHKEGTIGKLIPNCEKTEVCTKSGIKCLYCLILSLDTGQVWAHMD